MPLARFAAILLAAAALPSLAFAETFSCQIGKPSYCFKYGGALCEKWNPRADAASACLKWTEACLACHEAIPDCMGGRRPPSDSPVCSQCRATWHSCMARIDARYWPNRMSERN